MSVSRICDRLLKKKWKLYDLQQVPPIEGIYVIGILTGVPLQRQQFGEPEVLYVGRTNNVHRRLGEHMRQSLKIDEFIKDEFQDNGGVDLRVKWIEENDDESTEKEYIECIAHKLGYWPKYNIRR